jgi:hypothetical protein
MVDRFYPDDLAAKISGRITKSGNSQLHYRIDYH